MASHPPGQNKSQINYWFADSAGDIQKRFWRNAAGGDKVAVNKYTKQYAIYVSSEKYQAIKQDLLDQLDRNGTFGKYYTDLVDDYMDMWVTKCLLVEDIKSRGVSVRWNNGGGQSGFKKNDSVDQRMKINAQMLRLLAELDIKPSQDQGEDDDL